MSDLARITKPGIYTDFPVDAYFAEPCPEPSLTQSIAKILIEKSPLHAWHAHPRLNPDFFPDDATKYDVGTIAHKLMLGRGKTIVIVPNAEDWRTKKAQEFRVAALAEGKLAVLGKHYARATRMVEAAREQLDMRGLRWLFNGRYEKTGDAEVVLAWKEGDIWLRQMIDWLDTKRQTFVDYKTTDMSVAPHGLGRMMVAAGWPIQAAMAERGLNNLDLVSRPTKFYFVVQETEQPYCLNVVQIGGDWVQKHEEDDAQSLHTGALTIGGKMLDMAVHVWRNCMKTNLWPGYPPEIVTPEFPGWAESAWLEREVKDAARERLPNDLIMAG